MNNFTSVPELEEYLEEMNLLDGERLRPGWDTYFMVCPSVMLFIPLRSDFWSSSADLGITSFPTIKLHEAPRRRSASPFKANPIDRIQWYSKRVDELQ